MIDYKTLIRASREIWNDTIAINIGQKSLQNGMISVAERITFKEHNIGDEVEPAIRLNIGEAQRLMDELWYCGLRPSEGTGSAGSLKATENHLNDMKKIAFTLLDKVKND